MSSLAVFDFDRTIVDGDSDATIINRLREKKPPPEWDSSNHDWTPYMSEVFEHAYSAGLNPSEILDCIASMPPTPGVEELITTLAARGWDVLVLTDANSVFVEHWLKTHGLDLLHNFYRGDRIKTFRNEKNRQEMGRMCKQLCEKSSVTAVITNRAFWSRGRLYIEPCMRQAGCARCPANLCKAAALAQHCDGKPYRVVVYAGDGRNDFCPATTIPANGIVFPRRGYPLDDLIKKTLASPSPQVVAKVVPWDTCQRITQELFPENSIPK